MERATYQRAAVPAAGHGPDIARHVDQYRQTITTDTGQHTAVSGLHMTCGGRICRAGLTLMHFLLSPVVR